MSFWYYTTNGLFAVGQRMVWIDERLVGRVEPVLGGWVFYDTEDGLVSVGLCREETVHLGLTRG